MRYLPQILRFSCAVITPGKACVVTEYAQTSESHERGFCDVFWYHADSD